MRRGLLQTNKRDPWRAWHFHLALAGLHWESHSFQLSVALYIVSGAGWGKLEPDGSARHSAGMGCHMQGSSQWDGDRQATLKIHTEQKHEDDTRGIVHTNVKHRRHSGRETCRRPHLLLFFVSSWQGIRVTCRAHRGLSIYAAVCMGDPFCRFVSVLPLLLH